MGRQFNKTRMHVHCSSVSVLLVSLLAALPASASLFKTPEQEAAGKFEDGDYATAAGEFSDAYRRGVALYRAGRYKDAGEAFASVEREEVKADALYNLGNTRFKQSDYTGAIDAYQQSLTLRANDEDTLHNLGLAKKMVEQHTTEEMTEEKQDQPEEKQESEKKESEDQKKQSEDQQKESEEQKQSGDQQKESEQKQSGDQQKESEQKQSGDQQQESEQQKSGDQESEGESGKQDQESKGESEKQDSEGTTSKQDQESEGASGKQDTKGKSGDQKKEAEQKESGDQEKESEQKQSGKQKSEEEESKQASKSDSDKQDQESEGQESEKSKADSKAGKEDKPEGESGGDKVKPESDAEGDDKQKDTGEGGVQPDEEKGLLGELEQEQGIGEQQEKDSAGGDKDRDQQEPGAGTEDRKGGSGGSSREITEKDAKASQAVEKFDQMGMGLGKGDSENPAGLPDQDGKSGAGISMIMMDQWLEQIEGDPSYLLKNQFMIEERQELDRRGRMVMETRPW